MEEEVLCSTRFQYSWIGLRGMLPYLSLAIRGALQILNLANTMLEYFLGQKKEREKTRCWNALHIGEKLYGGDTKKVIEGKFIE